MIPRTRRAALAPLLAAVGLIAGSPARVFASGPELFGLGSEAGALVGAMAARGQGASAGHYDPAALVELRGVEAGVGLLGFRSSLRWRRDGDASGPGQPPIQSMIQPMVDPVGIVIGAATPVPLRGWPRERLFVGIALYVVPEEVVRVIAHAPEAPQFPYYDNRTQRLVVLPSLALRLPAGISLGVAINFLAGLDGKVQATEGATRAVEARVDEQVLATARLNAGLRWRSPTGRWAAALVYRQRFSVPFSTTTRSNVAGQPLDIDVAAEGLFTPDQLVLGGAARVVPWLQLSADLTLGLWSAWRGPYVQVASNLPIVGPLAAPLPSLAWRDTVSVRVGAEADLPLDRIASLRLRAGYGFESSPIPAEQRGVTNLLDGNKHITGAGVGLRFAIGARTALRLDAHGQLHVVSESTLDKSLAPAGAHPDPASALRDEGGGSSSNPGFPRITGGGTVWSAGLMFTVER